MGPFTGPPCTLSNQMFCWGHHVFQGPRHPRNVTTALLYLTAKQGYKMKRFIFIYKKQIIKPSSNLLKLQMDNRYMDEYDYDACMHYFRKIAENITQ